MKTTIVGAGAIGGLLASAFFDAGHRTTLIDQGETLAALQEKGLRVRSGREEKRLNIVATDCYESLGQQDFVVLAVKAHVLPLVAPSITAILGSETVIVSAMNGVPWWFTHNLEEMLGTRDLLSVDPGGMVRRFLPPARTIGCVAHLSSSSPEPGLVLRGGGNTLIFGAVDMRYDARAQQLHRIFRAAGFDTSVSRQISTEVWFKLWGNLSLNPLSVLTGATGDRLITSERIKRLALGMMDEARRIGSRVGIEIGISSEQRLDMVSALGAFKTSMLQDYESGKKLEVEAILGAVSEMGRRLALATPFVDGVLGLIEEKLYSDCSRESLA